MMISLAMLVTMMLLVAPYTNSAQAPAPAQALALALALAPTPTPTPTAASLPFLFDNCPTSRYCGNLFIPFPFGTSSDCSLDDSFLITCNHSYKPPKPFLNQGSIEVLDISLNGLMRVASSVASDCYDDSGSQINGTVSELTLSKFSVSSTWNKFTAVGCDTYALVEGSEEWKQTRAICVSQCNSIDRVVNGTCSGIGCCQISVPKGVKDFLVDIRSFRNHTKVNSFNPCGYAFVVETEVFKFSSSDLKDLQNRKTVPIVLDWSVGNLTCQEARKNLSSFACRARHSECIDSSNGPGYYCKCLAGILGNPYFVDGCEDYPRASDSPPNREPDASHVKKIYPFTFFLIASGITVPAVVSFWIFWRRKQKKVVRQRRNLFVRNGGQILEVMLSTQIKRSALSREQKLSIFKAEDLKKATNNFDENNFLCAAHHFGISYRGILPDGEIVTITKCNALDGCDIEGFISKLIAVSKIQHENIVRLLGCCLETQVPLLVYESFELQSLHDYIHNDHLACYLSWDIRLKVAAEIAGVLLNMQSCLDVQMINGWLSSSSILLDRGYNVKVHYHAPSFSYGSSVHFHEHTPGYLDPQYLLTSQFTVKSNVYSLGVILAEILTGKQVICFDRPEGEEGLAQYLLNSGKNLLTILDHRVKTDGHIHQLTEVLKVAQRCLSNSTEDRPTMEQVIIALEKARSMDF